MTKRAIISTDTVGTAVASDYKTSAVFYRHRIDFCCGGEKTIGEVCASKNLDTLEVLKEVNQLILAENTPDHAENSAPDDLARYITATHHQFVREQIPVIREFLKKLCAVHGQHHPELLVINELFEEGSDHLLLHMKKEEDVLFPMIYKMMDLKKSGQSPASLPHSTFMPIRMMRHEHETEGQRFARIAKLSHQYTAPEDGCNTYRATYALLQEFERDLHHHIHLENNILFPAVAVLEEAVQ